MPILKIKAITMIITNQHIYLFIYLLYLFLKKHIIHLILYLFFFFLGGGGVLLRVFFYFYFFTQPQTQIFITNILLQMFIYNVFITYLFS